MYSIGTEDWKRPHGSLEFAGVYYLLYSTQTCGTARKTFRYKCERKSDSKNIANPPGETKNLIWQMPEGIFQNNKHL